jgi:hypothetical protein
MHDFEATSPSPSGRQFRLHRACLLLLLFPVEFIFHGPYFFLPPLVANPDSKLKKKMSIRMGLHGRLGAYIDALCVRMNACEHALVLSHPHHNLSFKFIYYYQNQTEEYVELMFLEQRLITQRSSKYMWYHEHE